MGIVDIIVILSIVLIIGAALSYIIIAKRRGARCIGCPYAKKCSGKCPSSHTDESK